MTTLVWHMLVFGLLFSTSSYLAEHTVHNINEATDDLLPDEKLYQPSYQNEISSESESVKVGQSFGYHEKTLVDSTKQHTPDFSFQSSVSSSEEFRSKVVDGSSKVSRNSASANEDKQEGQKRTERGIDGDNIDLVEPKNDLELETRPLTNDVILETAHEISGLNYYDGITPTKTKLSTGADDEMSKSQVEDLTGSGEGERASPRGRSLLMAKPNFVESNTNATMQSNEPAARSDPDNRQGNSDIQDIINGFVKLLNGQVQVNTNGPGGRPNFPSRTRINNRGPPRINDVPPIIFDPPAHIPPNAPQSTTSTNSPSTLQQSNRDPPPYPFDIPQSVLRPYVAGVPLPEQIVPINSSNVSNTTYIPLSSEPTSFKEKHSNVSATSNVENVNRTQAKPSPSPVLSPVFVPPLVVDLRNNTAEMKNTSATENGSKVEGKPIPKPNTGKNSSNSPVFDIKDINPSTAGIPLKSSTLPVINTDSLDHAFPSSGVGTAVVVLEPSTQDATASSDLHKFSTSSLSPSASTAMTPSSIRRRPTIPIHSGGSNGSSSSSSSSSNSNSNSGYFPRPGIVLDDPEYKPGAHRRPPPIVSAVPAKPVGNRDVFDVTVSAIQGTSDSNNSSKIGHPYVFPDIDPAQVDQNNNEVITNPQAGQDFVSIDGKRTYLNLFDSTTTNVAQITPTMIKNYAGSQAGSYSASQAPATKTVPTKSPPVWKKPTHPPVRIDTCIVGDDSTCDSSQHERCRTEVGVSSCHCRPGYTRRKHREPCHRVVSLFLSLRVDRVYDKHLSWNEKLAENESAEYQQLEYEAGKAIDSALSMTPFSDLFLGAKVNNMYTSRNSNIASPVFVNMTIQLSESQETLRPPVKQDLQKHLMGVIQRRSNNIGSSALWVDNPTGVVSQIHDVDECSNPDLNDCHPSGKCTNVFGSFHCTCPDGYRDPFVGNSHRSGRTCETCDAGYCNHRGECSYHNGQPVCRCTGSYYGAQCEIDGEVLGVAVGSSLVAILIIITTLACLCAWSRRWNKEQKVGSPIFGYMPSGGSTVKTPVMGAPPYQVSLEDRLRWAQIADAMAHANHYGPEPVNGPPTRPASVFGYSLPHSTNPLIMPRLRPPSVHTLRTPESSTSEEEDRADLLGRNFHVPRPKSRSSIANQSGIYYDVDYDSQQRSGEISSTMKSGQHPCIPLHTYTMGSRSHYFNFRS